MKAATRKAWERANALMAGALWEPEQLAWAFDVLIQGWGPDRLPHTFASLALDGIDASELP